MTYHLPHCSLELQDPLSDHKETSGLIFCLPLALLLSASFSSMSSTNSASLSLSLSQGLEYIAGPHYGQADS